ncbi:Uncharacterised protein [Serratia fonticola]|uniref:Uncharacterized protein n=1 Tax=Serratia fonticola TaxID=47917 RepID=A0A3S4WPC3_SERFO|nr:Uncharacterised protein [Serratia fonticola]
MACRRSPISGVLLLVGAYSSSSWAVDCLIQRGYAGMEGISSHTSDSLWQFDDPAFRNNAIANLYLSGVARCTLTETLSVKAQASGEYALQARQPGALEDQRRQGLGILNEATASWAVSDSGYIDAGKVRKTSGYLFSVAPLDLLRNISGSMRSVRVFGLGERGRNFYDEGAYGISSSWYRNEGTFTLAAFPRLKRNHQRQEAASEWDAILRTNSTDRYYASYTATGLKAFNPTFSLLAGDRKTVALGTSGNLTDMLILSVEGRFPMGRPGVTWTWLPHVPCANLPMCRSRTRCAPMVRKRISALACVTPLAIKANTARNIMVRARATAAVSGRTTSIPFASSMGVTVSHCHRYRHRSWRISVTAISSTPA